MARQIQILPSEDENVLGKSLLGAVQGFTQGRQLRTDREEKSLARMKTMAEIEELQRKSQGLNAPAPTGYVRDPYSGDLKEDLSGFADRPGLIPTEYDRFGRAKAYTTQDIRSQKLQDEIAKKELSTMTTNLPKLEQAEQAAEQLKQIYYQGTTPPSVGRGDILGGLKARASGIGKAGTAYVGANPELQKYLTNRSAFAGLIAKGGFGEAGMLTNQDIQRVVSALPGPGATKEEAERGFQEVITLLGAARNRFEQQKQAYIGGGLPQARQANNVTLPQRQKQDGQIMTDAQGNRAMVYPDGSFEEV